ncbi:MAG: hypothetical protein PHX34_04505 [Candidatus Shapirobacteria bacterium]|nr:hypothetical protein [Candidatus Shapirobacteria bacterium]
MTDVQRYSEKKILALLKKNLTPEELEMYIESFSWHFKYNANKDFVVDLDMYWKKLGYASKQKAIVLIEKSFIENIDYSRECSDKGLIEQSTTRLIENGVSQGNSCIQQDKRVSHVNHGGQNIKKFFLTVNGFKNFCMLASTKEAKTIRTYYIKIENIIHEFIKKQQNMFTDDQMNTSNLFLANYGEMTDILYIICFQYENEWYIKFGVVYIRFFYERYEEHESVHGPACIKRMFHGKDVAKVESRIKKSSFYLNNKSVAVKKDAGGHYDEIFKVSPLWTSDVIERRITELIDGELDELPPAYSSVVKKIEQKESTLEVEQIILKQKEIELKQKEIDLKQMQLQFEMIKYKTEHQIEDLMECDDGEPEVQDQEMNSESEFKIRIYHPEPIFPIGLSGIRKSEILQKHVKDLCPIGMAPTREQGSDWKCNFPNCNKSDDHFNKMQDHIYNHHLNHRPYKCDKCIQGFIRMIDLVKHSRIH